MSICLCLRCVLALQAVELAAGQCLVVPELGFLWDVRKVMDMWRFVHSVVAETAYAAAGDR